MDKFYPEFAEAFAKLLSAVGRKVAVVGHARPDGDCIGSQVALARVLAARGLDVVCVNADAVPRRLSSSRPAARPSSGPTRRCSSRPYARDLRRLRRPRAGGGAAEGEVSRARRANIDHHLSNAGYAKVNLVDSASAATCEMLAGIFLDAGLPVDAADGAGALRRDPHRHGAVPVQFDLAAHASSSRANSSSRGASPAEAGYELYERESLGQAAAPAAVPRLAPHGVRRAGCASARLPGALRGDGHDGRGHGGPGRLRALRRRRRCRRPDRGAAGRRDQGEPAGEGPPVPAGPGRGQVRRRRPRLRRRPQPEEGSRGIPHPAPRGACREAQLVDAERARAGA